MRERADRIAWMAFLAACGRNGHPPTREWRAMLMADPCVYCGGVPTGLDHIQPASRGGQDNWPNRAPACDRCDGLKGNLPLLMFLWLCERTRQRLARRPRLRTVQQQRSAFKSAVMNGRRRWLEMAWRSRAMSSRMTRADRIAWYRAMAQLIGGYVHDDICDDFLDVDEVRFAAHFALCAEILEQTGCESLLAMRAELIGLRAENASLRGAVDLAVTYGVEVERELNALRATPDRSSQ